MNAEGRHKLLARQLRRHFGSLDAVPEGLTSLVEAIELAYRQADADRALLERAVDTVSRELEARLAALRETIGERDEVQHALSLLEAAVEGDEFGVLIVDLAARVVRRNARLAVMWPEAAAALDVMYASTLASNSRSHPHSHPRRQEPWLSALDGS